jgi:hypothetical protein
MLIKNNSCAQYSNPVPALILKSHHNWLWKISLNRLQPPSNPNAHWRCSFIHQTPPPILLPPLLRFCSHPNSLRYNVRRSFIPQTPPSIHLPYCSDSVRIRIRSDTMYDVHLYPKPRLPETGNHQYGTAVVRVIPEWSHTVRIRREWILNPSSS